ncbi:putative PPM-type phosphatase, divalent cation binding protein [Helianthus annuus]|nr:putative PPM-type phosphatase, divalent cation binding protein [Helianthus annuus]
MFLLTVFTLFYETKKKVSLDAFMLVFRLDFWLCIVHVAVAYLDPTTSFFGVYDGHGEWMKLNEGFIWFPRGEASNKIDDWAFDY